jgi:aminopeptidase N
MLEAYVGEEAFRAGVRSYIKQHAYGNTVSDDLWAELDKASPKKITDIAHDFTLQAGVPLIVVKPHKGGVLLTQERFGAEPDQRTPRAWRTPVTVAGVAGGRWDGVVSAGVPKVVPLTGPVIVNAGQTSYFRTSYAPALWAGIAQRA